MLRSKAQERDSDSELEAAAAKRKGSRGKIAVRLAHAPCSLFFRCFGSVVKFERFFVVSRLFLRPIIFFLHSCDKNIIKLPFPDAPTGRSYQ